MKDKIIMLKGMGSMEAAEELYSRWRNRAEFLKTIVLSDTETEERKTKALKVFDVYLKALTVLLLETSQALHVHPKDFELGGISLGEAHQGEVIINKRY
jgi:hypothetical protein